MSDATSDIISVYLDLLRRSPAPPDIAASFLALGMPVRDASRPCALMLSPHPDDECLTGGLPLRLRHEEGWQIINIAVTLGGDTTRRAARKIELAKACAVLKFEGLLPDPDAFSAVTPATRAEDPAAWQQMVDKIAAIIAYAKPRALFMPHQQDAHPAHIGAYHLGMDALAQQKEDFTCAVLHTEYWQPHPEPNLMIGLTPPDATRLLSALACHEAENDSNPFDIRFPAYLIDNVRRGSERVGGKGANAAPMNFAMLYKLGLWRNGKITPSALNRILGVGDPVGALFD